jgi:hypothetical protein
MAGEIIKQAFGSSQGQGFTDRLKGSRHLTASYWWNHKAVLFLAGVAAGLFVFWLISNSSTCLRLPTDLTIGEKFQCDIQG